MKNKHLTFFSMEMEYRPKVLVRIGYTKSGGWWCAALEQTRGGLKYIYRSRKRLATYKDACIKISENV